jgi:hypothetical protein
MFDRVQPALIVITLRRLRFLSAAAPLSKAHLRNIVGISRWMRNIERSARPSGRALLSGTLAARRY